MWEAAYAKENADSRLIFLRMLKKIWLVIVATVIGAVVVGGVYAVVKLGIEGRTYRVRSVYYIDFSDEVTGENTDYLNHYTWETLAATDELINPTCEALGGKYTAEELRNVISATIESDVRYLCSYVDSSSEEESLEIARAFEDTIVSFGDESDLFDSISVVDSPKTAEDISMISVPTAALVGAIAAFVLSLLILLAVFSSDSAVYVPATLEKRIRKDGLPVPTLTAPSMMEFSDNAGYLLGGKTKVGIVVVGKMTAGAPGRFLPNGFEEKVYDNLPDNGGKDYSELRGMDAVVLAVAAGKPNEKQLERTIEQLARQNVELTATMLYGEDEKLLKSYYRAGRHDSKNQN